MTIENVSVLDYRPYKRIHVAPTLSELWQCVYPHFVYYDWTLEVKSIGILFSMCRKIHLTHITLASHWGDLGKQCRPKPDAAVASGQSLHCLHTGLLSKINIKMKKYSRHS